MSEYIDLSHVFEDGMPGFRLSKDNGSYVEYTANINPFLTHEDTKPTFNDKCSFEITEMKFQTSIGTYLDSPYHRYPNGRDISELVLDELILPGKVIDCRGLGQSETIGLADLPTDLDLENKAVLFNFGWDEYWGEEKYYSYPYISEEVINFLLNEGVNLIGVDTINVDDSDNLSRPAHSKFLKNDIFIVENLTNLDSLPSEGFRIYCVPWKAKSVAAIPIRAFAEIDH